MLSIVSGRLTVRTKLFGGFGVALALLLVVSALAFTSLGSLDTMMRAAERSAVLNDRVKTMEIALRQGLSGEVEAINADLLDDRLPDQLKAAFARFHESLAEARKLQTPEMAKGLDEVEKQGGAIEQSVKQRMELLASGNSGAQVNRDLKTLPAFVQFLARTAEELERLVGQFRFEA